MTWIFSMIWITHCKLFRWAKKCIISSRCFNFKHSKNHTVWYHLPMFCCFRKKLATCCYSISWADIETSLSQFLVTQISSSQNKQFCPSCNTFSEEPVLQTQSNVFFSQIRMVNSLMIKLSSGGPKVNQINLFQLHKQWKIFINKHSFIPQFVIDTL